MRPAVHVHRANVCGPPTSKMKTRCISGSSTNSTPYGVGTAARHLKVCSAYAARAHASVDRRRRRAPGLKRHLRGWINRIGDADAGSHSPLSLSVSPLGSRGHERCAGPVAVVRPCCLTSGRHGPPRAPPPPRPPSCAKSRGGCKDETRTQRERVGSEMRALVPSIYIEILTLTNTKRIRVPAWNTVSRCEKCVRATH